MSSITTRWYSPVPATSSARSTAPGDVVQCIACGIPELGDRELDAGIDEVDEVVTDLGCSAGVGLAVPMSIPR